MGMEKSGEARGSPDPALPRRAAGVAGPGGRGGGARSPGAARGAAARRGRREALPGRIVPARPSAGLGWTEEQPSFPATIFQATGGCGRGREERGAGFVCLAPSYAFKQITENAAEGSSRAEFGTDKSRGRRSPTSDASHVFVLPFPILAFPINH